MKNRLFLALLSGFLLFLAPAKAQEMPLTVIELFTTQGCPNCPPADKILQTMLNEGGKNIIALGCHVTYFDTGPNKDALSQKACDARQNAYRRQLKTINIYMPQMIINGLYESQGNRENMVRAGVKMANSLERIVPIPLALRDNMLDITLPKMQLDKPVDLWLISYLHENTVNTVGGLPTVEPVTYVNAVKKVTKLMNWNGKAINMAYPLTEIPADGYAVIAQDIDGTRIMAAGKADKP